MGVEILGTDCYRCTDLEGLLHEVSKASGRTGAQILRIDDEREIRRYLPLDETCGHVIEGKLVATRVVPERDEPQGWLVGD